MVWWAGRSLRGLPCFHAGYVKQLTPPPSRQNSPTRATQLDSTSNRPARTPSELGASTNHGLGDRSPRMEGTFQRPRRATSQPNAPRASRAGARDRALTIARERAGGTTRGSPGRCPESVRADERRPRRRLRDVAGDACGGVCRAVSLRRVAASRDRRRCGGRWPRAPSMACRSSSGDSCGSGPSPRTTRPARG